MVDVRDDCEVADTVLQAADVRFFHSGQRQEKSDTTRGGIPPCVAAAAPRTRQGDAPWGAGARFAPAASRCIRRCPAERSAAGEI